MLSVKTVSAKTRVSAIGPAWPESRATASVPAESWMSEQGSRPSSRNMMSTNGVKGLAAGVLGMFKTEELEDVEERSEEGESRNGINGAC